MKIAFHPLFIIVIALSIWAGLGVFILCGVLAVLIHEFGHAVAANRFGVQAKKITLLPFGAQVNIECAFLPRKCQAIILLSGAVANMVACILALTIVWLSFELFTVVGIFITANMSIAILNLLPFYPLDGGKVIALINNKQVTKSLFVLSNVAFAILFLLACFVWWDWITGVFAASMLFSIHTETKNQFVSKLCKTGQAKTGKVREVAIHSNLTLFDTFKQISGRQYSKFIVTDRADFTFTENDLERYITTFALDTKIKDIIQ